MPTPRDLFSGRSVLAKFPLHPAGNACACKDKRAADELLISATLRPVACQGDPVFLSASLDPVHKAQDVGSGVCS